MKLTVLSCATDTLSMRWQMEVQRENLSAHAEVECVQIFVTNVSETEKAMIARYPALAKIFGLREFLRRPGSAGKTVLLVDPDVVFCYNPATRLPLRDKDWHASNCSSYMDYYSFSGSQKIQHHRIKEYRTARLIGGAQYLFKSDLREGMLDGLPELALRLFESTGGNWLAEMLAWHFHFGFDRFKVRRAMDFHLAHSQFCFHKLARGEELLMVHLAGDFKRTGTFDKQKYVDREPWDDAMAGKIEAYDPTVASYYFVLALQLAAKKKTRDADK